MSAEVPKHRLLALLRRATPKAQPPDRLIIDDSALWSAHERALLRTRDAGAAAQRIASTAGRQRSAIGAVADRARALSSRAAELHAGLARVLDAFERLGLVALNAGLEGARLGETQGKPLSLVADEVRVQSARGGGTARDLDVHLSQLASELGQLDAQVVEAQSVLAEVTQDATRAAGGATDAEGALLDIAERVKKATGSDPEAVRAIAEASERARGLVSTLAALSGKVPRDRLQAALAPLLEPLARWVLDDADGVPDVDPRAP